MDDYSIEMFANMFDDERRHGAYSAALKQAIQPGDVVVDIGTGLGTYAMLAAKLGAGHVYAIETNPLIGVAVELAEANGLSDRITFVDAMSTEFDLPEPADVVFADLRGTLPYHRQNIASMRDARVRLLRPGGILMPTRDTTYIALASNPSGVAHYRGCWNDNPFELDLSRVIDYSSNVIRDDRVAVDAVLSAPIEVGQIDYIDGLDSTDFAFEGTVTASAAGTVDGLAAWFEAVVVDGISYSTSPSDAPMVYGAAFFPFEPSVEVAQGGVLNVSLSARLAPDGEYIWNWGADGHDAHGEPWSVDHNTLLSGPLDIETVHRRRAGHCISDSAALRADVLALGLLGEGKSLGEVAEQVAAAYPGLRTDRARMLTHIADLAAPYDR